MNVLIWGAANGGRNVLFSYGDTINVLAFIDNDSNKINSKFCDLPVISKYDIDNFQYDKIIIANLHGKVIKEWLFNEKKISKDKVMDIYDEGRFDSRVCSLKQLSEQIYKHNIKGDVAELGVFKGEFAKYINQCFRDRKLYLFDTFSGFNEQDINIESNKDLNSNILQDFSQTSIDVVKNKMSYPENCIFCKGYFPETTKELSDTKFCFVNIDADLYKPIYEGLKYFYERLEKGGFIMVHDYYCSAYPGAQKAVMQFAAENNITYVPIQDSVGSIVICK